MIAKIDVKDKFYSADVLQSYKIVTPCYKIHRYLLCF